MAAIAESQNGSFLGNSALSQGDLKSVLALARGQLSELLQQRATLVKRITTLRRTLNGLVEIFGDDELDQQLTLLVNSAAGTRKNGLTDACRSVLMNSAQPLPAADVVSRVRSLDDGLLRNHKNALASVTSILYRLQAYGEAVASTGQSGRRAWAWIR
jgi:hypothetical protein